MHLIGIIGPKNSGKTTLITRLIPALGRLGLSVSTIKHVHHTIDLDQKGKDTFAHREAGAVDVLMFSEQRWALLHERTGETGTPPDFDDLLRRFSPVDVVLVEGFKSLPMERIEIRQESDTPSPAAAGSGGTIAIVTDGMPPAAAVPVFGRDDVDAIAAFVAGRVRLRR
jgi:molybdopterin-guanine dinucleotide biosynthesis protein B